MVEHHNKKAAEGVHGYTMSINQFSDLTYEEFEETVLGFEDSEDSSKTFQYFQVVHFMFASFVLCSYLGKGHSRSY